MPYARTKPKNSLCQQRPWVALFGALLAGVAGFVNVVLLEIFQVPVSHMSGAVSRLSIDLASRQFDDLLMVLAIVGGFLLGTIFSGLLIGATQVQPGRRYGVALLVEGALLAIAALLLLAGRQGGIPVAAMACGLQNAMASSYYGLILRTTHVTGIVTDIGVLLGHWLRYGQVEFWKLRLLGLLLGGFFCGGLLGGLAYARLALPALFIPALGCAAAGFSYYQWRRRHLPEEGFCPPHPYPALDGLLGRLWRRFDSHRRGRLW